MRALWFMILFAPACMQGPGFMKQNQESLKVVGTKTSEQGVVQASLDGSSDLTQVVQTDASSPVGEVKLSFPPGSVAINTTVGLEPGVELANAAFVSETGLADAGEVSAGGQAIVISTKDNAQTAQPFTVALPIPAGSSLLGFESSLDHLVVLYKVLKDGVPTAGILPRSEIQIVDGFATFSSQHFGSFQLAFTEKKIETKTEAAASTPILTKNQDKALPAFTLSKPTTTLGADRAVTFATVASGEVSTCRLLADKDGKAPYAAMNALGAATSGTVQPIDKAAHQIQGRFDCQDKHGRFVVSEWSSLVNVPAADTPKPNGDDGGTDTTDGTDGADSSDSGTDDAGTVDSGADDAGTVDGPNANPVPGNSGVITLSTVIPSSGTISWTAATDDASGLSYAVCISSTGPVASSAAFETACPNTSFGTGLTHTFPGLSAHTTYYVNVKVKDSDNATAYYAGASFITARTVASGFTNGGLGSSFQRHALYDTVNDLHWMFHVRDATTLYGYYSADGATWTEAAGQRVINSLDFEVAYSDDAGYGMVIVAAAEAGDIVLHTLKIVMSGPTASLDVTTPGTSHVFFGDGQTDSYSKPSLTINRDASNAIAFLDDALVVAAFRQLPGGRYVPYIAFNQTKPLPQVLTGGNVGLGSAQPVGLPIVSPQGLSFVDYEAGPAARLFVQADGFVHTHSVAGMPNAMDPSGTPIWQQVGAPPLSGNQMIKSAVYCGGSLFVAGDFTDLNGIPTADYIAKWNPFTVGGGGWSALTSGGPTSPINVMICHGSEIFVGGGTGNSDGFVKRYNGSWNNGECGQTIPAVYALARRNSPSGTAIGGGGTSANSGYVAFCDDASTWQAFSGGPIERVWAVYATDSDIYAGGNFSGLLKTSSTTISSYKTSATGSVTSITEWDASNLLVGGTFTDMGAVATADRLVTVPKLGGNPSDIGTTPAWPVTHVVKSGSNHYAIGGANRILSWNAADWEDVAIPSTILPGAQPLAFAIDSNNGVLFAAESASMATRSRVTGAQVSECTTLAGTSVASVLAQLGCVMSDGSLRIWAETTPGALSSSTLVANAVASHSLSKPRLTRSGANTLFTWLDVDSTGTTILKKNLSSGSTWSVGSGNILTSDRIFDFTMPSNASNETAASSVPYYLTVGPSPYSLIFNFVP